MGTSTMRQFLQSLCHGSHWSYAVYWKIEHENEIILKWNDAYCDYLKLKGSAESKLNDTRLYGSDMIWSSSWGLDTLGGYIGEYSIGQAVADMASFQYPWGKGVIGEAVCTGNHYWAFYDLIATGSSSSKCPDEWVLQFTAGIKTILLVPIVPYGVLQLGSLEKVAECPALVGIIRDRFSAYQNNMDAKPTIDAEFHLHASSSVRPVVMNRLDELSAATVNQIDPEHCNGTILDACLASGKDRLGILNSSGKAEIYINPVGFLEESKQFDQSVNGMIEDSVVRLLSLQEEFHGFSHTDNCYVDMFGAQADVNAEAYSGRHMNTEKNWVHDHSETFTPFDVDCELQKALGPTFFEHSNDYLWSSSVSASSSHMLNRDSICGTAPLTWESGGFLATAGEAEHLLEAVVSSTRGSLNENSPEKPNEVMSVLSSGQSGSLNKAQSQSRETAYVEERKNPHSSVTSALASSITYAPSTPDAKMNTLTEDKQQKKDPECKKGPKLANAVKKRGKPGENPKPRPRDRQLLQDRFKELRELVPNGSKCSIDGLLDRTIKHMLFLGSVSNRADKLRQLNCQQGNDGKNVIPSNTKYNQQNGKSWAVELGPELQVCPILVEDLGCPGYMLIEMRCNDHSVFLEISDAIRRLELTILKGVMETRDDNKWAHFVVEAPRGFHRLDILLPLMQLLQHN